MKKGTAKEKKGIDIQACVLQFHKSCHTNVISHFHAGF